MAPTPGSILAINGGSSSITVAVYQAGTLPKASISGTLDRISRGGTTLSWRATEGTSFEGDAEVPDDTLAPRLLIDWLEAREEFADGRAVGHRVVHGMAHTEPIRVMPDVVDELRRASSYAPDHLPHEIELIEAFRERHPHLPQVACFDTAFHGTMSRVATLLALPRRYQASGVRRYGFHGLSSARLIEALARIAGPEAVLTVVGVLALGMALVSPNLSALISTRSGSRRAGTALDAQNAANSLGQASGPLVGGALFVWQMNAADLLSGGLLVALALVIGWKRLAGRR